MSFEIESYDESGHPIMIDNARNVKFHYQGFKPNWHTNAEIYMPDGKLELRIERQASVPFSIPYNLTWHVTRVFVYEQKWPIEKKQEIVTYIEDALKSMATLWQVEKVKSVSVNFEKTEWR